MREKNLVTTIKMLDGIQKLYRFDNGFGASVIKHKFSYGGKQGFWELGIISWEGDSYELTILVEDTGDVKGWLDESEVDILLDRIDKIDMNKENTYRGILEV